MTVKASDVIRDSLEDIVVQSDEAKIEQSEGYAAIRALNDLMFDWAARGINLGFTLINDLGDILTVPPGAIRGIKANLALELAPKYGVPVTAGLVRKAKAGYEACLNLSIDMSEMAFPPTLPMGSGNDYPDYSTDHFYPDQQGTILEETGGSVALEEGTEDE